MSLLLPSYRKYAAWQGALLETEARLRRPARDFKLLLTRKAMMEEIADKLKR